MSKERSTPESAGAGGEPAPRPDSEARAIGYHTVDVLAHIGGVVGSPPQPRTGRAECRMLDGVPPIGTDDGEARGGPASLHNGGDAGTPHGTAG